ncbi:3-hydroxyacyl-CoA dehydrogenase [Plebeiibacterium sediminum]|uniref:3-hydroxyacyl-CoA dehydrogenase n=1 Tax=Plebeiibacterium sediminum TaxID=2992112 RepID=A0AAE3SIJ0_9BACT|nr:3-hydroxyacyl-CoA dehydrogenase [Plebeiobacterium sediminum]MCW3789288.1 3-hydroxyacyl-CoA dehydrogenase [Plebeiobacterium sediminum]
MEIKKVMIAGGGVLGSQVAWQTAFHGFMVTVYDAFEKGIETSKSYHQEFAQLFLTQRGASQQQVNDTLSRISYTTNLQEAVDGVDMVSESVPEDMELKVKFWTELGKVAPADTIFTTNTSSTLPSFYAEASGRPEKFLALHFATGGIWDANIAEVMGQAQTKDDIYEQVVDFAKAIGMVAIPVKKENPGYVMNAVFIPFLLSGLDLVINEISTPEYVDKTWVISTKSTYGPCAFMDIVGMGTVYHTLESLAVAHNDESFNKRAQWVKENFIDKGKMGMATGEGFYKYPNPAYASPEFLKN